MTVIDLTGKRFGKLVVIELDHIERRYGALWKCRCDCGNETVVRSNDLRTGNTKSCGCYKISSRFGRRTVNLTGKRYGKLTVLEYAGVDKKGCALWKCKCDCGNEFIARSYGLCHGDTKSCGCLVTKGYTTRRISKTILYRRWKGIKERCYNPNNRGYSRYGGRGIYMCDEWLNNPQAFYDWAISSGFKPELSIDRKDNNGPYAPWNCRWADSKVQGNNKRNTRHFMIDGKDISLGELTDWCIKEYGVSRGYLHSMLESGWSPNAAVHKALHPELGIHRHKGCGNNYYDKDGFMVLIPKYMIDT